VNAAWGGYERMLEEGAFTWPLLFWKQQLWRFDAMFASGLRAAYAASFASLPHTKKVAFASAAPSASSTPGVTSG